MPKTKKRIDSEERKIYKNLEQALRRKIKGIKNPGTVASLLIEVFTNPALSLSKELVIKEGLCDIKAGSYAKWRLPLEKESFITSEIKRNKTGDKTWTNYLPGKNLRKYINKIKNISFNIATVEELNHSSEKLNITINEMKQEMETMKAAIDRIIYIVDPKPTDKKRIDFIAGKYDCFELDERELFPV